MSSAALFLLTAGLVCGRAAAEKKLVYVTVVSDINMWCISKEAVLNCVAFLPRFLYGVEGAHGTTLKIYEIWGFL